MKVLDIRTIENCLDGTIRKEIQLSEPINRRLVRHLEQLGSMEYHPDFPRPFFKVSQKGAYILKGVEGLDSCQVIFIKYSDEIEMLIRRCLDTAP